MTSSPSPKCFSVQCLRFCSGSGVHASLQESVEVLLASLSEVGEEEDDWPNFYSCRPFWWLSLVALFPAVRLLCLSPKTESASDALKEYSVVNGDKEATRSLSWFAKLLNLPPLMLLLGMARERKNCAPIFSTKALTQASGGSSRSKVLVDMKSMVPCWIIFIRLIYKKQNNALFMPELQNENPV